MTRATVERAAPAVDSDDGRDLRPYVLVLLFTGVFALALRPALDLDQWWHLRTAQWMVDHRAWIGVDPFQHTRPGVVRVQTDWLADLSYWAVWKAFGLAGISVLVAALATLGTFIIHRATTGLLAVRVAVTALVAVAASIHWSSRPQMFTFVLTATVILLVERWRATGGEDHRIWLVVPLVLLGSNLHGGIVYAVLLLLAVVGGVWLDALVARLLPGRLVVTPLPARARRRLTLIALAAVAVMAVNPSGVRIYGLPFHQVSSAAKYVSEVQPPSVTDAWTWPFFLLLAATAVLVARSWRRFDAMRLAPVLLTLALALQFVRSIPFFALAVAPLLADRASAWWATRPRAAAAEVTDRDRRRLRQAVALVVGAVVVTTPFRIAGPRIEAAEAEQYPVGAVAWLNEHRPPGELFNDFNWGGYLILHAPDYRVSIDGRTDVYDEYLDVAMATVAAQPGWAEELDREGIGTVLLPNTAPLTGVLAEDPGWTTAYRDDVASVFVRR